MAKQYLKKVDQGYTVLKLDELEEMLRKNFDAGFNLALKCHDVVSINCGATNYIRKQLNAA